MPHPNSDLPTAAQLDALRKLDTPTVCNALEVLRPARRGFGYTTEPLTCVFPDLPRMVGYARTATIRSMHPEEGDRAALKERRLEYYSYIEAGPRPSIVVLQDIDPMPGYGSFWGEVQSNVHKGLGALGTITNGCVRDIPECAPGFQFMAATIKPSHAFVHVVEIDVDVDVCGMAVKPFDLIHADRHGAVVIPYDLAGQVPEAAALVARKERLVIDAARKPGFSVAELRKAFAAQDDIH
jgi:regulator of RNase E activity RraA